MENYIRLQTLLQLVLERFCDGNKAELARRLQKDASYINRLFYPQTKAGAKGIGQEIMDAAKKAFPLPLGFWDMEPTEAFGTGQVVQLSAAFKVGPTAPGELILALAEILKPLSKTRRESVKPLLVELATNPQDATDLARLFENIVGNNAPPHSSDSGKLTIPL